MRVLRGVGLEEREGKGALPDGADEGMVKDSVGQGEGGLPETAGEGRDRRGGRRHGGPSRGEGDGVACARNKWGSGWEAGGVGGVGGGRRGEDKQATTLPQEEGSTDRCG